MALPENDMTWPVFFEHYAQYEQHREKQKREGLNDYSLLASILRVHDEVRLHSRFLYSMLDPHGTHGQNSAFGEAFMAAIGYAGWLDWSKVRVYREHDYIDLYLTDGERHVLVENKLNAIDQPGQVRRYIDLVKTWCAEREMPASAEHILFVYLSNGRRAPARKSLQPYALSVLIDGSFVVDQDNRKVARYVNTHYRDHVRDWIASCIERGGMPQNLRNAFEEYRVVVERVTRTYKSRVMDFEDFLLDNSPELDSAARIRHAFRIARDVSALKAAWLVKMFDDGLNRLLDPYVNNERLIPIIPSDGDILEPFQFAPKHARRFFVDGSRDAKNKGRFWRIGMESSFGPMALAVLFGANNLHIGVLPVRGRASMDVDVDVDFDKTRSIDAFRLDSFEFRPHVAINKVFHGLTSWTVPLNDEIEHLSTFEGSRPQRVVSALLEHVFDENAGLVQRFKAND